MDNTPNTKSNGNGNSKNDLRARKVDQLSYGNQDFHGGRIKNASPSQDLSDYIIKKELNDAIAALQSSISTSTSTTPSSTSGATYILDVLGILYIQSSITPRRYITLTKIPSLIRFDVPVGEEPTGHSLDIILYQNTTAYFTGSIADGASSKVLSSAELYTAGILTKGNYLRLDVTAVGTTYKGSNLVVTIVQ